MFHWFHHGMEVPVCPRLWDPVRFPQGWALWVCKECLPFFWTVYLKYVMLLLTSSSQPSDVHQRFGLYAMEQLVLLGSMRRKKNITEAVCPARGTKPSYTGG